MAVVCILIPRFSFVVAAGAERTALIGRPAALAPELAHSGAQAIGEISPGAEAYGLRPGMRLGEALARCPELMLLPADPLAVADEWERVLTSLEAVGAAVESPRPGVVWLDAGQLARLHGRTSPPAAVRAGGGVAPPWLGGVIAVLRGALESGHSFHRAARVGAGSSRFVAHAAALKARARAADFIGGPDALRTESTELLATREQLAPIVPALERLGLTTLGDVADIGAGPLSDRFGIQGQVAHELARGIDDPVSPRDPSELLQESFELPEAVSGPQLTRALGLLIDRMLARRERRGRTLRSVVLGARLVEGGTWRTRVVFREPLGDRLRMRTALEQHLLRIPAPAATLLLRADSYGPVYTETEALFGDDAARRRERIREAVVRVRAVGGPDAALRVMALEAGSRVPERRLALTPREA